MAKKDSQIENLAPGNKPGSTPYERDYNDLFGDPRMPLLTRDPNNLDTLVGEIPRVLYHLPLEKIPITAGVADVANFFIDSWKHLVTPRGAKPEKSHSNPPSPILEFQQSEEALVSFYCGTTWSGAPAMTVDTIKSSTDGGPRFNKGELHKLKVITSAKYTDHHKLPPTNSEGPHEYGFISTVTFSEAANIMTTDGAINTMAELNLIQRFLMKLRIDAETRRNTRLLAESEYIRISNPQPGFAELQFQLIDPQKIFAKAEARRVVQIHDPSDPDGPITYISGPVIREAKFVYTFSPTPNKKLNDFEVKIDFVIPEEHPVNKGVFFYTTHNAKFKIKQNGLEMQLVYGHIPMEFFILMKQIMADEYSLEIENILEVLSGQGFSGAKAEAKVGFLDEEIMPAFFEMVLKFQTLAAAQMRAIKEGRDRQAKKSQRGW